MLTWKSFLFCWKVNTFCNSCSINLIGRSIISIILLSCLLKISTSAENCCSRRDLIIFSRLQIFKSLAYMNFIVQSYENGRLMPNVFYSTLFPVMLAIGLIPFVKFTFSHVERRQNARRERLDMQRNFHIIQFSFFKSNALNCFHVELSRPSSWYFHIDTSFRKRLNSSFQKVRMMQELLSS